MATTMPTPQQQDQENGEDFTYWYDRVLSGFSTTDEGDLETIYSGYADDSINSSTHSTSTPALSPSNSVSVSSRPSLASTGTGRSASTNSSRSGFRPLPLPPPQLPNSSSYKMPTPEPFDPEKSRDSPRPSVYSNDSSFSNLHEPRHTTASSVLGDGRRSGLPSTPRPLLDQKHSSSDSYYSSSGLPSVGSQNQDEWAPAAGMQDYSNPVTRTPSSRPPGTLAPVPPGHDQHLYVSDYKGHTRNSSQNTIGPGSNGAPTNDQLSMYGNDSVDLDRSTSISSSASISQNPLLSRHPSTTLPISQSANGLDPFLYPNEQQYRDYTTNFGNSPNTNQHNLPSAAAGPSGLGGSSSSPNRSTRRNGNADLYNALGRKGRLELHQEVEDEYWEDEDEDENQFINLALLSHIAVQLKDRVPRGVHVKGSVGYQRAFTGRDVVSTIQSIIQRELSMNHNIPTSDRRPALQVARCLQSQLFFYEVEWGGRMLQDGVEDVYMFQDDAEASYQERAELPTGVVTIITQCYSPGCSDEAVCYAWGCPRKGNYNGLITVTDHDQEETKDPEWINTVPAEILSVLSESEINRQTIIHKVISKEVQYLKDLDIIETYFMQPLRAADPPILDPIKLDDCIDSVFGNILDLRECNRRLLEVLYVRQREQRPVIQKIGDVFLGAATDFRLAYPTYLGNLPLAEQKLKEQLEANSTLRLFLEQCSREIPQYQQETVKPSLKQLLSRPFEHLQKYPTLLKAIYNDTPHENPDADFLKEAIKAITNLHSVAQLRTFQSAMGKGATGKWEWNDLVSTDARRRLSKDEIKRQSVMFELIKGEMAYVKDLENIELMYIRPLRAADPPIIPRDRLNQFITDVFHNFAELHVHHKRMVEQFHEIQREEHPVLRSITAPVFDAALNFREAYMDYVPNYPIAAYRIDDEMATNPAFKKFVDDAVRHPDAHRLDMKNFINRPIPRLLRYELLLKSIRDETPQNHEDRSAIPQIIEIIKALGKETEPGVVSAKSKVELWKYNSNLVFKQGEWIDMDLLDEQRSLLHTGKLLRQPETGFEWSGWSELFVLLFDNYLVMTKVKESKDGITKYHVNRRPIPLDLLTIVNFTDPPTQRTTGILRGLRGGERHVEGQGPANGFASPEAATDSRVVYPCTLHHNGRMGGPYILYAESAQVRTDWKQKLEEALGLRKVVQESNKVFEIEPLSSDTFTIPAMVTSATPAWNENVTGKVTCSVPFTTADGRGLVAVGCAAGVWIGFRHDSRSMRQVLHLKMVTQCAMLENFGIFLVLADKSLFAYHIEALVPSGPNSAHFNQAPEKLNGAKDVHFFSVGTLHGRTLVVYMKKKGLDSVFRVLEPVGERINDRSRAPAGISQRFGFRPARSAWFRVYRDFFLPSESFDLVFLKAQIAILCTKGFEIMDLTDFKSVTIPQRDDAKLEKLVKRCEACRPLGMFRCTDDEFLLCYDEFGLYIDKHGDPSRNLGTIEWEGRAERVALHHPYVLLFDSRFIEIRHIETGRLTQIISGHDIRCLWDGRGLNSNNGPSPVGEDGMDQEARVHGVMTPEDAVGRSGRAVPQQVFELIPTIPLYLPGSLASPSEPSYFAQSFSPPHSPTLRPQASYRS